jgi:Ran GTPase-activating protein (RanGAP) involved in mRNA processing and transport
VSCSNDTFAGLCKLDLAGTKCFACTEGSLLASSLSHLPSLQLLRLASCSLADATAAHVIHAIANCHELVELDLAYNLLGSRTCAALAGALHSLPSLNSLQLARCGLHDADAAGVLAALAYHHEWQFVGLARAHLAWLPQADHIVHCIFVHRKHLSVWAFIPYLL